MLERAPGAVAAIPNTPLRISRGSRGRIVEALQQAIEVPADGVCGPVTMGAAERALGRRASVLELHDLWDLGVDIRLGVDLSGHNEGGTKRAVDFAKLRSAGVTFAWLKLTEGRRYRNAEAARQVGAARAAGIKVGGYHFANPSADRLGQSREELLGDAIRAEAPHFLETQAEFFGPLGPDLVPMLDIEAGYLSKLKQLWASSPLGRSSAARAAATRDWCAAWLKAVPGAGIYTARWAVQAYLSAAIDGVSLVRPDGTLHNPSAQLLAAPLWLASYNTGAEPARPLPAPWAPCHVWQCSGSGSLPGVDGKVDLNIALGADMRRLELPR